MIGLSEPAVAASEREREREREREEFLVTTHRVADKRLRRRVAKELNSSFIRPARRLDSDCAYCPRQYGQLDISYRYRFWFRTYASVY